MAALTVTDSIANTPAPDAPMPGVTIPVSTSVGIEESQAKSNMRQGAKTILEQVARQFANNGYNEDAASLRIIIEKIGGSNAQL